MELAIIIVNYNTKELTAQCLESVFGHKMGQKHKVVVVDNGSSDGSVAFLRHKFPTVEIVESANNLGFAGGNNLGIERLYKKAEYILLLNSDTIVQPGAINALVAYAKSAGVQIASCKLLNSDGSFQANGGDLPSLTSLFVWLAGIDDLTRKIMALPAFQQRDVTYFERPGKVGWVGGTAMLVNSIVFKKIGFLDTRIFMYGEDVEFCLRATRAGFSIGWTGSASVVHLGGASTKSPKLTQWTGEFRGLLYITKKYYGRISCVFLKLAMYIFIFLRICAFFVLGRRETAYVYAKVLKSI